MSRPEHFDGRPELREYIHENLGLAAIQIDLARTYAELGDDHGLAYALRRYAAYSKAVFATFKDLRAHGSRPEEGELSPSSRSEAA
jgi:hypothetical protein